MWHIDAEIICFIFISVLMVDIFKTNAIQSLRDKLFHALTVATVFTILADIISSYAMMQYQTTGWWFIQISLIFYFVFTPLLSTLWQLYAIAVVKKEGKARNVLMLITTLPFLTFAAIVVSNPYTGWLFHLSAANAYTRGFLFDALFFVFYGYSISTLLLACVNFKKQERTTSIVLMIFPLVTGFGIFLQQVLPGYLVTGTAFTLVILITYLFLQNRKATRDNLTGLFNRLAFSTTIDTLSRGNAQGTVLAVAVDDFKVFNQTFGQKNGDMLLQKIAAYLIEASPNKTCYRYGGDIFTIILKKVNEQQSRQLADEIMNRFAQTFHIANVGYSVSVSIGIVEYPHRSSDKNHSIITALDFSIYQAKKRGKGQIAFYNEDLLKQFKRKHDIVDALTRAVHEHSFAVFIQPIYHVQKQKFLFGEALLRLNDKNLGWVSPAEFIPIAEETGQIVTITYFVLEEVCSFLNANRQTLGDTVSISVNFSMIQFMQDDMVERVKAILQKYVVSPSLIKIEITESIIADSLDDIKNAMHALNDFGIRFALDDYGHGYSNISYLINLPFRFVKLDKSVIDPITEDQTFISALIPMFKRLNKVLVAEGVETKEQADILGALACDSIQGFYFARPMPMEQAAALMIESQI